jgi:hypothetical protein
MPRVRDDLEWVSTTCECSISEAKADDREAAYWVVLSPMGVAEGPTACSADFGRVARGGRESASTPCAACRPVSRDDKLTLR